MPLARSIGKITLPTMSPEELREWSAAIAPIMFESNNCYLATRGSLTDHSIIDSSTPTMVEPGLRLTKMWLYTKAAKGERFHCNPTEAEVLPQIKEALGAVALRHVAYYDLAFPRSQMDVALEQDAYQQGYYVGIASLYLATGKLFRERQFALKHIFPSQH